MARILFFCLSYTNWLPGLSSFHRLRIYIDCFNYRKLVYGTNVFHLFNVYYWFPRVSTFIQTDCGFISLTSFINRLSKAGIRSTSLSFDVGLKELTSFYKMLVALNCSTVKDVLSIAWIRSTCENTLFFFKMGSQVFRKSSESLWIQNCNNFESTGSMRKYGKFVFCVNTFNLFIVYWWSSSAATFSKGAYEYKSFASIWDRLIIFYSFNGYRCSLRTFTIPQWACRFILIASIIERLSITRIRSIGSLYTDGVLRITLFQKETVDLY